MSSKYQISNTSSFYNLAWISFAISFIGMVLGLIYLQMDFFQKAFIGMTYLFSTSSCFVLAKVIRDKQEANDYIGYPRKVGHFLALVCVLTNKYCNKYCLFVRTQTKARGYKNALIMEY